EVAAPVETGAVAVLGDSITDGSRSTPETYNRWSDHLARRLNGPGSVVKMGVLNVGIAGNRLGGTANNSALARFDKDVLAQPGITHVIVMEGINDLGQGATTTANDVISAEKQLIDRAHAKGLRIIGSTITPVEGVMGNFAAYFTPETEMKR